MLTFAIIQLQNFPRIAARILCKQCKRHVTVDRDSLLTNKFPQTYSLFGERYINPNVLTVIVELS